MSVLIALPKFSRKAVRQSGRTLPALASGSYQMGRTCKSSPEALAGNNVLQKEDAPVHHWYRFVLSYPPHLVRQYFTALDLSPGSLVFDPFCGTGTTLVEAKKMGFPSFGTDSHPFAVLVTRVKIRWDLEICQLRNTFRAIVASTERVMSKNGLESLSFESHFIREGVGGNGHSLSEDAQQLLPTGFVSERPLRRLLILRDEIEHWMKPGTPERDFFLVALANVVANGAGNFAFGPEIYRTKPKSDYDVLGHFSRLGDLMILEVAEMQARNLQRVSSEVRLNDARILDEVPDGIDAVITSPPYPNEKDYTRTTRVESVLLKLILDRPGLREIKESLLRSNTRNVFVADTDSEEAKEFRSIQRICRAIERRRVELNKTSGFERLYHKVVAHYFGGLRRHFRALRPKLRHGAKLAYVVGDQLSFLMVPISTARLLGEVAESEGFEVVRTDLWRMRTGTKVRNSRTNEKTVKIREEILVLKKA